MSRWTPGTRGSLRAKPCLQVAASSHSVPEGQSPRRQTAGDTRDHLHQRGPRGPPRSAATPRNPVRTKRPQPGARHRPATRFTGLRTTPSDAVRCGRGLSGKLISRGLYSVALPWLLRTSVLEKLRHRHAGQLRAAAPWDEWPHNPGSNPHRHEQNEGPRTGTVHVNYSGHVSNGPVSVEVANRAHVSVTRKKK